MRESFARRDAEKRIRKVRRKKGIFMWKIIKAEYLHTISLDKLGIFKVLIGILFLLYFFGEKGDLIIAYLYAAGVALALPNDRRFYLFQILPVTNKIIATARLIMLAINYLVLLIITTPFIIFNQANWVDNLSKLFTMIGILLLIRLFSFSLFDITSGLFSKKHKKHIILLFSFVIPVVIAFIYIVTAFFRKPELQMILIALSFSLIPLFTFISIRTFLAKERILVGEK